MNNTINGNRFNNIKELCNDRVIWNSRVANSNGREGSDLVGVKVVIIIINKLSVNKNVLNYLNIIKKTNSKNVRVLDDILEVIKKTQSFLKDYLNKSRQKVTRIFSL